MEAIKKSSLWDALTQPFNEAVDTLKGKEREPASTMEMEPMTITGELPAEKTSSAKEGIDKASLKYNKVEPITPSIDALDSIKQTLGNAADGFGDFTDEIGNTINSGVESLKNVTEEYPNFWVGAAPMLMGAVLGDIGLGAQAGSEGLMQRYKDERDAKIAERKAEQKSKDGSGKLKPVYDPVTGKTTYMTEQEALGREVGSPTKDLSYQEAMDRKKEASDIRMKKHIDYKKDEDGRLQKINKLTGKYSTVFDPTGLAPENKKRAEAAATKFNKVAEPLVNKVREMETGLKDLVSNNQLSNKLSVMRFIKEVETRLSDYDRAYYTQEISDMAKMRERARKIKGNSINPRLVKDALGLVSRAMTRAKKQYGDTRSSYSSQLKGRDFPQDKADAVFGDTPTFMSSVKMNGPDGAFEVPIEDLQDALDMGYQVMGDQ